jgi:hypothetical protein
MAMDNKKLVIVFTGFIVSTFDKCMGRKNKCKPVFILKDLGCINTAYSGSEAENTALQKHSHSKPAI